MATVPDFNPYAAPKSADLLSPNRNQISYDGKVLTIPKEFTFPPICLKSGAVTDLTSPRKRRLTWYPPLLLLLFVLNPLVFALVAIFFSKKGVIHFQLSQEIARKRRNVILRNWGLFSLSIMLGGAAAALRSGGLGLAAIACLLLTIILSSVASRFLWSKKVDKTHIYLCGVPDDVARVLVNSADGVGIAPFEALPDGVTRA